MLGRLDHIGYRVSSIEETIAEHQKLFGSVVVKRAKTKNGVPMAFITMGDTQLEFLENTSEPGQHLDHVAYEVDDIDAEAATLKAKGAHLASPEPVTGSNGSRSIRVNMLGSVIQIFQPPK